MEVKNYSVRDLIQRFNELEAENQKLRLEIDRLMADKQELESYANIGKAYVEFDKVVHVQKFRNPFIYAVKQMEWLNNQDKE